MTKVLVVATSRQTHGGISSVIKVYRASALWKKFHCMWIETHIDKDVFHKLLYLMKSFISYLFLLPYYNIVHIHTSEPASAIRKCPFMWWAKLWKKKVIIHFHAFSPDTTIRGKWQKVYRYLFNQADVVIVLSNMWRDYVNETFHLEDKVQVVYNPCTPTITNKTYLQKKQILYAGTINARKGYADMIEAFALIAKEYPDWQIIFAGNGEVEQGKALAKELGITGQTVFLGWVNGEAKDKAFKEATIFCLPSYAEGFPMAVLEAWAYGKPVIATSVGGLLDIAVDGENALVFEPGDIHALAKKMEMLICDKDLRRQLADNGLKLSDTIFSPSAISEQLGHIYEELSNNPQKVACK